MKKHTILLAFLLAIFAIWGACSSFVDEVDPIINEVQDDLLNDETQIPFLITGVQVRFATTHDQVVILAEGLSDAFIFDSNVPNATFPTYLDIDVGEITCDNNSIDGMFFDLGELRFFADNLLERVDRIGTFNDADLRTSAVFTAHFFGGIARYFFAAYMGISQTEGGGVIDNGPFIPSADMYGLALEKFQAALANLPVSYTYGAESFDAAYLTKLLNSLIARIHLYTGNSASALQFAQNGLVSGDPPFQSKHSAESTNLVWQQAGLGRSQYVLDPRFLDYVTADPNEAARIQFTDLLGNDGVTVYQLQTKHGSFDSPIDLMSWQENELMLAESDPGSALTRINNVRASHGLAALGTADQATLITERDKELLLTGARLPDQRRFGIFHLPAGTWQFLAITERERNNNPNLPQECP